MSVLEVQKSSLTPRRQVRVRRTYSGKRAGEVVKPSRAEVASITEEEDGDSEGSSQSFEFMFDMGRTFTKDGSPEVCVPPACEGAVLEGPWRGSEPVRPRRKMGSSRDLARTPPVRNTVERKPPGGRNQSRAMSVPAALPSTALCGDYGVYQNDAFGSDSSQHWEDCFESSSSSEESEAASPAQPGFLLKQLPGCPYEAEAVHDLPRTGKRNPLCPFPRRSTSPCPARFSSVPPVSIPPTFTVEQSPLYNRGESWKESKKNEMTHQLKVPEKHTPSKEWPQNTQPKTSKRFTKGMSAPPADFARRRLSEDDRQENLDVGMFLAAVASAKGIKLRDFINSDLLSQNFMEVLGLEGSKIPGKKPEKISPSSGYVYAGTHSRQKEIETALQRVRICLPGFGPDRSMGSLG